MNPFCIMLTCTCFQDFHGYQEYVPDRIILDSAVLGLEAGDESWSSIIKAMLDIFHCYQIINAFKHFPTVHLSS